MCIRKKVIIACFLGFLLFFPTEAMGSTADYAFSKDDEIWVRISDIPLQVSQMKEAGKVSLGILEWSPDGTYLAWLATDTSKFLTPQTQPGGPSFSTRIIDPDTLYIWSAERDTVQRTHLPQGVDHTIQWSSQNNLVLKTAENFLTLRASDQFAQMQTIPNPLDDTCAYDWDRSTANQLLIAAGDTCRLYTLNLFQADIPVRQKLSLGGRFTFFEQSPNGKYLAHAKVTITGIQGGEGVWIAKRTRLGSGWRKRNLHKTASAATHLSFSPNGKWLVFKPYGPFESLFIVNVRSKTVRSIPGVWFSFSGWLPDGRTMIWRYRTQDNITMSTVSVDVATGALTYVPLNLDVTTPVFRPGG